MAEKYSEIKVVRVGEAESKDGHKFPVYKTMIKDKQRNKLIDVRFTRDVTNRPTEPCIIRVADKKWNIDRSGLYPICWVKEILEIVPLPEKEVENPFI